MMQSLTLESKNDLVTYRSEHMVGLRLMSNLTKKGIPLDTCHMAECRISPSFILFCQVCS